MRVALFRMPSDERLALSTPTLPAMLRPALLAVLLLISGCANLGYYTHLAGGQLELLRQRQPIARIIADPARDAALRARLAQVLDARAFASSQLDLPDNRSYTLYADLGRPYVLWNVFATPAYSLEPVRHCFVLAGCLSYRGWFDEAQARAAAEALSTQGDDVYVSGVPAYSTLGWFDDPVLNTMLRWNDDTLIGTVFHELAHQRYYLKGDSAYSESLASFVEQQGLREYLAARGRALQDAAARQRQRDFTGLILSARQRLDTLYRLPLAREEMERRKQAEFARLRADYATLRDTHWRGYSGYDRWFDGELNNAKLLPFGLYDEWVEAFALLYARNGRNWQRFYAAVEQLGAHSPQEREWRLRALLNAAAVQKSE